MAIAFYSMAVAMAALSRFFVGWQGNMGVI
jgi:hypothetical protein